MSASGPDGIPDAPEPVLADVPRETRDRLAAYAALLRTWQARINLIGRATLDDLWRRHIADSAQLFQLLPPGTRVLVDLGSGAGFPGLVLAMMGVPEVHLIESHARKAAFLREAARVTATPVQVHARRIEQVPPLAADVVTARALAPLAALLDYAQPFLRPHTVCLFPKGRQADEELTAARKGWKMRAERIPSLTDPSGTILRLSEIARA